MLTRAVTAHPISHRIGAFTAAHTWLHVCTRNDCFHAVAVLPRALHYASINLFKPQFISCAAVALAYPDNNSVMRCEKLNGKTGATRGSLGLLTYAFFGMVSPTAQHCS